MSYKKRKLAVVGGGVASEILVFQARDIFDITYYDGSDYFPTASLNSTAIVSSFGLNEPRSEHAKVLKESFGHAIDFYSGFLNYEFIEQARHEYICKNEVLKPKFLEKFGHLRNFQEPCLLINAQEFMKFMKLRNCASGMVMRMRVTDLDKENCTVQGEKYDLIVLATGAFGSQSQILSDKENKYREGSYLLWENYYFKNSFHKDYFQEFYISHRKSSQQLLLGSSSNKSLIQTGSLGHLKEIYRLACHYLDFDIPPFEEAKIKVGIRELAKNRASSMDEISSNIFQIHSLYKNGWTLAPYYANLFIQKFT